MERKAYCEHQLARRLHSLPAHARRTLPPLKDTCLWIPEENAEPNARASNKPSIRRVNGAIV